MTIHQPINSEAVVKKWSKNLGQEDISDTFVTNFNSSFLVHTDSEGRKLVDYTSLIPVLIDAINIKELKSEVEELKKSTKK